MKKIISYSLYNQRHKDNINAIINCFLAKEIFEDWVCRFYIDDTIPESVRMALESFDNTEIIKMPRHRDSEAMLWRFLPAGEEDVDIMISRDADSWLSYRELICVDEFMKSDKNFHIIRDHCYHSQKIMGGMWGAKKGAVPNMKDLIDQYVKNNKYDQGFLADFVYDKVIKNSLIHLGDQYDIKRNKTNGYFNDGGIPIPSYDSIEKKSVIFDFKKIHSLNLFNCIHCGKNHETFIGAILQNIPKDTLFFVRNYLISKNINTEYLDQICG